MKRLYLAGAISADPETQDWRKYVVKRLGDTFEVDNPAMSKFDKEAYKEGKEDPEGFYKKQLGKNAEIFLPKSYQAVAKCDIFLVNLLIDPPGHAGHIMELAWAWQLHKTIIAIRGEGFLSNHPMVRSCVNAWAEDEEEACDIIRMFFGKR